MIYKRSSTSPRLTFADERVVASTPTVSRQNSVARSVEENVSKVVPKVNPENHEVRVDGEVISSEPAEEISLAQRYFLF